MQLGLPVLRVPLEMTVPKAALYARVFTRTHTQHMNLKINVLSLELKKKKKSNAAFIDLFQGPSGFPGDPGPPGEPGPAVRNLFSSQLVVEVLDLLRIMSEVLFWFWFSCRV